ncbi:alpha/beta fold hydrolase [Streptomyces sp. NRRL B-3648]|uniref:alpha/beta fold hydrolase n=1 Tax=Streptomyces sp. NRRL B-3648 TaxID=1519493 RepID=UPI00099D4F62|nr:alpha/beta hydrolase [Streptomyces sp. NRRL B-3648]
MSTPPSSPAPTSYKNTPNRSVSVRGVIFVHRRLGPDDGVPLILLNHLSAVLDDWDPRVADGLAARRPVVTFDNRGVGAAGGTTPDTIEAMARDTVLFIRALGYDRVDLLGLSMGGFIAQVIAAEEPDLVRKLILAGTGPAGGPGIDKVTSLIIKDTIWRPIRQQRVLALSAGPGRSDALQAINVHQPVDDRAQVLFVSGGFGQAPGLLPSVPPAKRRGGVIARANVHRVKGQRPACPECRARIFARPSPLRARHVHHPERPPEREPAHESPNTTATPLTCRPRVPPPLGG